MNNKQTEEFRKQLIEQREQIVAGWADEEESAG